jgi:ribulose-bisphosphate carboxylase large chain
MRICGADAVIFPSFGGRFSFSRRSCGEIASSLRTEFGGRNAAFPVPAGGMSVKNLKKMVKFYGADTIFLIGGDLHRGNLAENCSRFRALAEQYA